MPNTEDRALQPLDRANVATPAPPVRMIHLGLGAFFRAHQAWYTHISNQSSDSKWGYAAFTGRSAEAAESLQAQDGLYSLVTRRIESDSAEIIGSIAEARPASDRESWLARFADPEVVVVTITITEAGYAPGTAEGRHSDAITRLVEGLAERRRAASGGMAIVSCDNLPSNGDTLRCLVSDAARAIDVELDAWIRASVTFPNTMVDRITPKVLAEDLDVASNLIGWRDRAAVVAEPYSEWVLEDAFPSGRPDWERAGATFVENVQPYEQRKLLLLNGAHSVMAYYGGLKGHRYISDCVNDPDCLQQVRQWWDGNAALVALPDSDIREYEGALLSRWSNKRIRHSLEQIASDGSQKMPVRLRPILRTRSAGGAIPAATVTLLAAWLRHLRGFGVAVHDVDRELRPAVAASIGQAAIAVLALIEPHLADDVDLRDAVVERYAELKRLLPTTSSKENRCER